MQSEPPSLCLLSVDRTRVSSIRVTTIRDFECRGAVGDRSRKWVYHEGREEHEGWCAA